ncbi:MAG: D-alanyl-D-alanine carboxypeptidase family protein [Pseudomonadota bacterium]
MTACFTCSASTRPVLPRAAWVLGLLLGLALSSLAGQRAAALDTAARAALLVDLQTGAVLLEKNPDIPLPPASMSKLMTLYMLFEAVASGKYALDDMLRVSDRAAAMGGSKMFVRAGERVRIIDLMRGIIVQSGNDACVVIAEALAGSEEAFAMAMTQRGKEIGLTASTFTNATGWPHPGQRMTARDLVILTDRLIADFPQFYPYFAETEFTWDAITQRNRNPLLYLDAGVDGLKTGHTEEAGYGLVASALRDGRRVALVVTGLDSKRQRAEESERLISWAFREFRNRRLFTAGAQVATAEIWLGEIGQVPLVTARDIYVTLPFARDAPLQMHARYDGPIEAPIEAGQRIGTLVVETDGLAPATFPLLAGATVARGGYVARVQAAASRLLARLASQF